MSLPASAALVWLGRSSARRAVGVDAATGSALGWRSEPGVSLPQLPGAGSAPCTFGGGRKQREQAERQYTAWSDDACERHATAPPSLADVVNRPSRRSASFRACSTASRASSSSARAVSARARVRSSSERSRLSSTSLCLKLRHLLAQHLRLRLRGGLRLCPRVRRRLELAAERLEVRALRLDRLVSSRRRCQAAAPRLLDGQGLLRGLADLREPLLEALAVAGAALALGPQVVARPCELFLESAAARPGPRGPPPARRAVRPASRPTRRCPHGSPAPAADPARVQGSQRGEPRLHRRAWTAPRAPAGGRGASSRRARAARRPGQVEPELRQVERDRRFCHANSACQARPSSSGLIGAVGGPPAARCTRLARVHDEHAESGRVFGKPPNVPATSSRSGAPHANRFSSKVGVSVS